MPSRFRRALVWLRRDLRLADNTALWAAAQESEAVVCAFVLDPALLRGKRVGAPIVAAFFDALGELRARLRERGSDLALLEAANAYADEDADAGAGDDAGDDDDAEGEVDDRGAIPGALLELAARLELDALYYAEDAEPAARARDAAVSRAFRASGRGVVACRDHAFYWADEVRQASGKPYTVFTPYKRRWLERFAADSRPPLPSEASSALRLLPRETIGPTRDVPAPEAYGHRRLPGFPRVTEGEAARLLARFVAGPVAAYQRDRNDPARDATSHLSPHLRAGTIGIRTCVAAAANARQAVHGALGPGAEPGLNGAFGASAFPGPGAALGPEMWLSELVWRDFYLQILANYPHVARDPFLSAARDVPWRVAEEEFVAWCEGRTGYPIVDAAMIQLNTTGWMHNRLRMIVASFLTKHVLIDYRRGERYFERHLADADLAANNGGWQWAASTGTDAAPYFRVFNPTLQSQRFDPAGAFIRTMLPQLAALPAAYVHAPETLPPLEARLIGFMPGRDYPLPIVEHAYARRRALAAFKPVLGRKTAPGGA
jgi:deoxyribodipyrimidine photo-lyase